jgi:hypothetical protein
MKKIMLTTVLFGTMLLNANPNKEIKQEAKHAIMKMGKTLQMNMKKNMKKGGALKAAKFCSQKAMKIEYKVNKSYKKGVSVKRISLKYRNPKNAPTKDEAKVLEEIQNKVNNHQKVPKMIVKQLSDNTYKVYKPIFMAKKVCLKCHGTDKTRNKKAYKVIKETYPHDKAINYKKGDFRGAFVAEITK